MLRSRSRSLLVCDSIFSTVLLVDLHVTGSTDVTQDVDVDLRGTSSYVRQAGRKHTTCIVLHAGSKKAATENHMP